MKTHRLNTSALHNAAEGIRHVDKVERVIPTLPQPAASIRRGTMIPTLGQPAASVYKPASQVANFSAQPAGAGKKIPTLTPQVSPDPIFTAAAMNEALDDYSKAFSAPYMQGATKYTKDLEKLEKEYWLPGGAVGNTKALKKLIDDTSKAKTYVGALHKALRYLYYAYKMPYGAWDHDYINLIGGLLEHYKHSRPLDLYLNDAFNAAESKPMYPPSGSKGIDYWLHKYAHIGEVAIEDYDEAHDD